MGGQILTLGDVYSYGILLLELFTGKRRIDEIFKDGLSIHKFTTMALPEQHGYIRPANVLLRGR